MAVPGYRDDIIVSGPLTTSDYFVLVNVLTPQNGYSVASRFKNSYYNIFSLGLVTEHLSVVEETTYPDHPLYFNPNIIFSAPLTAELISGGEYEGAVHTIYVRYENFSIVSYDNDYTATAQVAFRIYDEDKKSIGYIDTDFSYASADRIMHTIIIEGVPSTSQFYSGVPFQLTCDLRSLGYNVCSNTSDTQGYCTLGTTNAYSAIKTVNATTSQEDSLSINRLMAIPISYYRDSDCKDLKTTPLGKLSSIIGYQQCLISQAANTFNQSSTCDYIPQFYTTSDTCKNNPNGSYVVSTRETNTNTYCGRVSQYIRYAAGYPYTSRTATTTSFGPCDSDKACLYDTGTSLFACDTGPGPKGGGGGDEEGDRNTRLILIIVVAVIIVVVIICAGISILSFLKKRRAEDEDDNKPEPHTLKA